MSQKDLKGAIQRSSSGMQTERLKLELSWMKFASLPQTADCYLGCVDCLTSAINEGATGVVCVYDDENGVYPECEMGYSTQA
jgi:hypothetical protein